MKRDLDLIKEIMESIEDEIFLEKYHKQNFNIKKMSFYTNKEKTAHHIIDYHVRLIKEMDFTHYIAVHYCLGGNVIIEPTGEPILTPKGHEFLDSIKDNNIFKKISSKVMENGGNLPFEIIKELGMSYLKEAIGLK